MAENRASRLLYLLTQLRKLGDKSRTTTQAWEIVLGESAGTLEFDKQRAATAQIVLDLQVAIQALESSGVRTERYRDAVTQWSRFVLSPPSAQGNPYDAVQVITDAEIDHLSSLADLLDARRPEVQPDPTAIEDLMNRVNDLRDQIIADDALDQDLRFFLSDKLGEIADALITVRIRGGRGIDEVLGRVLMDASRSPGLWERVQESNFWQPFRMILDLLNKAAGATGQVAEIADNVDKIRQLGGG